ncbi:hypothetical protein QYE76_063625 [Lolium multiflorum]|uniref:Retrotransposon gag domain-containing protein n=1 Tax=Lolium multiflorum TaxID=4521 RepID=A0AAD8S620_LOLMU|nr:hypothetical protein QYE76_063625 [Lolium multiflorum]
MLRVGTSAESENSHNIDNVSAVLDDSGSLGSFLDATIAKSRQIENTETPNAATPVNSPESVEYSSDDLDEDYVELDNDFIEKCKATTDARKIKKLLAEHAVRYTPSPDPKFATSPINIRDKDYDFSLDLSHIAIVEKTPFCGTEKESAVEHLTELSTLSGVFSDDVKMRTYFVAKIFPFSLKDDAKTWYNNLPPGSIKSPTDLRDVFFRKYFPASAQHAALQRIYNFDQKMKRNCPRLGRDFSLIRAQPDHDLEKHDLLDIFYSGLTIESRAYLDSCAGCVFRKRTPEDAEELLAKIGRNHDDWSTPEPTPTPIVKKRGMIKLNDEDMREAKKSLKEKGIKPEDVKNLPPIEDICETIPPSSMIEYMKDIVTNKRKVPNEEISTMLANYSFNGKIPKKLGDPAIGVPQWGSCEKIRGTPRELSDLYTRICNGRSLSNDGLNFSSRNLLDSAAGGTFMSITLGAATKLLDDMMINYSEWHTERTPQCKKVNSVEETSSLSDKIDVIMSMLVNGKSHVDPNNVPLASLFAQEDHVYVNFIKNNNFNNNAYRNNFGNNNYRPYPSNSGNGYGNSYGNSCNNSRSVPSDFEVMLKEFISTQTAFNKSVEEKFGKIDVLASKVDSIALDVDILKLKVMPNEVKDTKSFATANAIQVRINDNIRMMAELHARWEREEKLAKENNIARVWTITTTSNVDASHVAKPPTINGKIIGVGNVSTSTTKRAKLPETVCDKSAEIFQSVGDNGPIALHHNGFDFDNCHISEVIKFLQKLSISPNASAINLAFTKHITNALIKAREEELKLEASIPRKLEDGWEPIIKMKVNDFDCNALCDLGASISVMPKKLYDMLDLPPLECCYLDVNLADNSIKKPLGRIDNVHITVNNNLVPVDFVVLDIECNASCPIVLGRPFLRTVGAIIDMKEGNIKYQFPLKKGLEHFPRKRMKIPFDSIIRTNYDVDASSLDVT